MVKGIWEAKEKQVSLQLLFSMINMVKEMFNRRMPVTSPELNEILHHEKVNVSTTYFNKYNELFVLCYSAEDLDAPIAP